MELFKEFGGMIVIAVLAIIGVGLFKLFSRIVLDKLSGGSPIQGIGLAILFAGAGYLLYKIASKLWEE